MIRDSSNQDSWGKLAVEVISCPVQFVASILQLQSKQIFDRRTTKEENIVDDFIFAKWCNSARKKHFPMLDRGRVFQYCNFPYVRCSLWRTEERGTTVLLMRNKRNVKMSRLWWLIRCKLYSTDYPLLSYLHIINRKFFICIVRDDEKDRIRTNPLYSVKRYFFLVPRLNFS